MHVITVVFEVSPKHRLEFLEAMRQQARNSVELEPGCSQFDVCLCPDDDNVIYLYEIYDDEAAFQDHLASEHFKDFDATVAPWLVSKSVKPYRRIYP